MGGPYDAGWHGRIEPVAITNASGRLPYFRAAPEPCAVFREGKAAGSGLTIGAQYYRTAWSLGEFQVLVPAPLPAASAD